MQSKYGKDGFAAVSVSLDDPMDKIVMANVQKFLEEKKAAFTNLVLDEKLEVWQEKLKFEGPPCLFVFNRAGQWQKFDSDTLADGGHEKVEKLVEEWLKQK
jgi:hypothetical protein